MPTAVVPAHIWLIGRKRDAVSSGHHHDLFKYIKGLRCSLRRDYTVNNALCNNKHKTLITADECVEFNSLEVELKKNQQLTSAFLLATYKKPHNVSEPSVCNQ